MLDLGLHISAETVEDELKAHNFNLREYSDIADIDLVRPYSVVLCDIRGVGRAFGSILEGAHVIDQIRKRYPETIIVAYTGQQFDPTYNVALRQSDFVMKKDADSDEWVATLEQAIQLVLDPAHAWERIRDRMLSLNVATFDIALLEDQFVAHILDNSESFPKPDTLRRLPDDARGLLQSFTGSVLFQMLAGL